jgi:hypothetical protein
VHTTPEINDNKTVTISLNSLNCPNMRNILFFFFCVLIFSSCRKTVGVDYHYDLVGEWVSMPDTTHRIVINNDGSGRDDGRHAKHVYVKTKRDLLIFQRNWGHPSKGVGHPRTTYYILLPPTMASDTILLDGELVFPGEIYMKLVDENTGGIVFAERYYRKR